MTNILSRRDTETDMRKGSVKTHRSGRPCDDGGRDCDASTSRIASNYWTLEERLFLWAPGINQNSDTLITTYGCLNRIFFFLNFEATSFMVLCYHSPRKPRDTYQNHVKLRSAVLHIMQMWYKITEKKYWINRMETKQWTTIIKSEVPSGTTLKYSPKHFSNPI